MEVVNRVLNGQVSSDSRPTPEHRLTLVQSEAGLFVNLEQIPFYEI